MVATLNPSRRRAPLKRRAAGAVGPRVEARRTPPGARVAAVARRPAARAAAKMPVRRAAASVAPRARRRIY